VVVLGVLLRLSHHSNGQGRWPVKYARFILDLLKNAESNAEVYNSTVPYQTYLCFHNIMLIMWIYVLRVKGLDVDTLYVSHIQLNQAQKQRRRTYRAHGHINHKSIWSWSLLCYERFFICSVTSCLPTWCTLDVLPVPHWAHLVGEGRACEERCILLYTLCAWLFESKQGINVVLFGSMVSLGWAPDRNQDGLEKGVIFCDWLSENFCLIICRLIYLNIVCKCFVTLITAWTAHTIHQAWELSVGCFNFISVLMVVSMVMLICNFAGRCGLAIKLQVEVRNDKQRGCIRLKKGFASSLPCMLLTLYHEYNCFSTHFGSFWQKKILILIALKFLCRSWCMLSRNNFIIPGATHGHLPIVIKVYSVWAYLKLFIEANKTSSN
jgi:hypothetical protein